MNGYQDFLRQFRTKQYKKGELILCQGDDPPSALVVRSGVVKVYNLTRQGEEKPIDFCQSGDVFPLAWVFGRARRAQYYYEAFNNCGIACVPAAQYLDYIERHPEELMKAQRRLVERVMGFEMRVNALEQSKAACKIVNVLHFLCLRFGEEIEQHKVKISIVLTQQDIANLTGLTRETAGLELKKLIQQGVLGKERQRYTVRTDKLNELIDEDYDKAIEGDRPQLKA